MANTYFWNAFNFTINGIIVNSGLNFTLDINWRAAFKLQAWEALAFLFYPLPKIISKSDPINWYTYFFTSCCTAYAPSTSLCTAIRCHWAGLGKSLACPVLWSNMPPVPTVKIVTFFPFLNIFWTGTWPTFPQIIACAKSPKC